jgi:uncharacterized MAPEG superfamily protein
MTIAFWCVLVAGLMPYITVGIAKYDKSFDNQAPRDWLAKQGGYRKRAHAAHLNCFEAFPFFAAAVIIAYTMRAPQGICDALAVAWVIARIAFVWAYVADKASVRSIVWVIALGITIALFFVAAFAKS